MLSPAARSLPEAVQRLLVWSALGCVLVRADGRWCLRRPDWMTGSRGPAPKAIQNTTAQAAIAAGARAETPDDLFGRAA